MRVEDILDQLVMQSRDQDGAKYYISLINDMRIDRSVDPVKSIILEILSLCSDGRIDPWDVDLLKFAEIMNSFFGNSFIDFQFAGKAIADAWRVLRIKSDMSPKEQDRQMNDIGCEEPEDTDNFIPQNQVVIQLVPSVLTPQSRPVVLVDLIDEIRRKMYSSRLQKKKVDVHIEFDSSKLNPDRSEEMIEKTYRAIIESGKQKVFMSEIWGNTRRERAVFFLYSMFLFRDGRISLSQEEPNGDILIETNVI
ncbi:TVG0831891 [Thermoplasma volcanium GSS1]|uniref:TVG0831891 protein n=1 Tax=Thermoplasma volcanium (strain ATCC 51530 / DSM 4299 / JCM 9571 / NBRC 15438 / GSS1) TaxID=273116 RepID=Q97AI8_THEVO|nr:ScpA family protein [Thermoplasma volcanium]BAB59964.1 TVG0831891 [Thermoplasma volcanium GSS1]